MRRLGSAALAVAGLALASCEPPHIDIAVREGGAVSLSQDWGLILPWRSAPCVASAQLGDSAFAATRTLWRIEYTGLQCRKDMRSLRIGETPAGFRQAIALPAGTRGRYVLRVEGIGTGYADVDL